MRCASHVVRDVHLMRFEMCISYMHTGLLARKMKQSSLRQQCFLESCECFLQLRVYCLCADVQLLRHLCIALFLFAQADEYFTATLRQAVERLDISGKQFFADKSVFGRIGLAGKFGKLFGRECRYNPQIQISAESETKRSIFRKRDKTKRSKKESAQHSKSRNKSFVMTSVSAL